MKNIDCYHHNNNNNNNVMRFNFLYYLTRICVIAIITSNLMIYDTTANANKFGSSNPKSQLLATKKWRYANNKNTKKTIRHNDCINNDDNIRIESLSSNSIIQIPIVDMFIEQFRDDMIFTNLSDNNNDNPKMDNIDDNTSSSSSDDPISEDSQDTPTIIDDATIAVKEHKKSNAIGDPDGDGSDDDDDDDDINDDDYDNFSDWEDIFNDIETELINEQSLDNDDAATEVQLEVEYVKTNDDNVDNEVIKVTNHHDINNNEVTTASTTVTTNQEDFETSSSKSSSKGGIGIRFGNIGRNNNKSNNNRRGNKIDSTTTSSNDLIRQQILEAPQTIKIALNCIWNSLLIAPPSIPAMEYLHNNAKSIDVVSKLRLDRRTLYAGLMFEWNGNIYTKSSGTTTKSSSSATGTTTTKSKVSTSHRKFLDQSISQALQAALSLASQPVWRKSFPRTSGIRLYKHIDTPLSSSEIDQSQTVSTRGCTLAMQETIAMALAHSLGAGFVVIDDKILARVRVEIKKSGIHVNDEDIKPTSLIKALFHMARNNHNNNDLPTISPSSSSSLKRKNTSSSTTKNNNQTKYNNNKKKTSISKAMFDDLKSGLDDPFDDRASTSCNEMKKWEELWYSSSIDQDKEKNTSSSSSIINNNNPVDQANVIVNDQNPSPLVIFLRVDSSTNILSSKSTVEFLIKECDSSDSTNLLVLGRGIDINTETLPHEPVMTTSESSTSIPNDYSTQVSQSLPGAAPWFGFTSNNQNASGQNDPEGSRRFNIFLSRTIDQETGSPGIIGAIATPQAGNLFPHLMAMQARARLQQQSKEQQEENDSPMRAELEKWATMLHQQMQTSSGDPLPPPQFFNATFTVTTDTDGQSSSSSTVLPPASLPPEVIQQTLEHAMSELLDRLAKQNEDGKSTESDLSPELQRAFSQVLRNENFRKGIAENLARAAPALSDPKCQGVLLSVFVPPPHQTNRFSTSSINSEQEGKQSNDKMGGWFQKILNNQEENGDDPASKMQKRVRTMAAAAAVLAAQKAEHMKNSKNAEKNTKYENKAERNLKRLESICRPIIIKTPTDPVRAKSWDGWINRERGAVIFRQNRKVLIEQLKTHYLSLQEHTGTRGAGSAIRSMLSVRSIADEMDDVIKCTIEIEAAKSQRQHKSPNQIHENEMKLDVDMTLSQLLVTDNFIVETEELYPSSSSIIVSTVDADKRRDDTNKDAIQFIHPSSLEKALTMICRISPSPGGGSGTSSSGGGGVTHRTREEIASLAQDKHERALVSQVVSPQDIGVTYDMIGGLTEVKELLRQSITYPLKFPHLYCEGIAREAVKGVLLFGPPGTLF